MTSMPVYAKICQRLVSHANTPEDRKFIVDRVSECNQAIKVDVSHAYRVYADKKTNEIGPDDYPCCVPPWKICFLEWKYGGRIWLDGVERHTPEVSVGALCVSADRQSEPNVGPYIDSLRGHLYDGANPDDVRYMVRIQPFGWDPEMGNAVRWLEFTLMPLIASDGRVLGMPAVNVPKMMQIHGAAWVFAQIPMFAFSLANCKNIVTEQCVGEYKESGYSGRKKKQRKFYRYHVLKIDGGTTGESHQSNGSGPCKPMHICRGNFARYTDEKPLFGKYTGLFWRPMHVRGSVKHGVVDKDYKLATA